MGGFFDPIVHLIPAVPQWVAIFVPLSLVGLMLSEFVGNLLDNWLRNRTYGE